MTLRVMQVLHQGGGAGSVTSTLHLSLGLARAGVHVRFVCPPGSEVEALARGGGLEVHPLGLRAGQNRANADALGALLAGHPVDVINSQSSLDRRALTWLGLTGRLPAPLVVTRRQMPLTFFVENWLVSRVAAKVVAVGPSVGEALVRRGTPRRKLIVIPNGVVTDRIDIPVTAAAVDEWKARIGWEPSRRTVGIVARQKDQSVVLRALDMIRVPLRLVLAGIDPQSPLGQSAARISGPHVVVCLPFSPEVRPLYELLELVLLPSRLEGFSQGLLEAMALGKPVIASASSGNRDLITDRVDGRLVDPHDPAAWASAIQELLGAPAAGAKLGSAARHTARDTYPLSRTVGQTVQLYRALLGASVTRG